MTVRNAIAGAVAVLAFLAGTGTAHAAHFHGGGFHGGFHGGFARGGFHSGFARTGFHGGFARTGFHGGFARTGFHGGFAHTGFHNGFFRHGFHHGFHHGFSPFFVGFSPFFGGFWPRYYYPGYASYNPYYYSGYSYYNPYDYAPPAYYYATPSYTCPLGLGVGAALGVLGAVAGDAPLSAPATIPPVDGAAGAPTYPYDGGPRSPLPAPRRVEPAPAVLPPTPAPEEGQSGSLQARAAKPSKFAYAAYGEEPVRTSFAADRAVPVKNTVVAKKTNR